MPRPDPAAPNLLVVASLLAAALALSACGGHPPRSRLAPRPNDAIVTLDCDVKDAEVWVDGRFEARVYDFRGGMALAPGEHKIVIRHDQYHDQYVELDLEPRERRVLEVRLAEILP